MERSCTLSDRNLRDDWLKKLHRDCEETLHYTDIASCERVVLTKEQHARFEKDIKQLKLPARVIYMTSGTLRRIISGFYNKETGNVVCMHHRVVEELIRVDPTIFDGWEVVVTDETADVGLTELPKNLDGYKDETNEDYIQRIKNRTEAIRHNEEVAVRDAESNEEINRLLRSL